MRGVGGYDKSGGLSDDRTSELKLLKDEYLADCT